jgi:uncharacterized damage-inducible protein DinB
MAKAQTENTLESLWIERWEQAAKKVGDLAEALPEEKLESRIVPGIRTAGEVLRHIAFWNQYLAASLRGEEPDGSANELPSGSYGTKTSIIEALNRSSKEVSKALSDFQVSREPKTAESVMAFVEHTSEHYGQLVVYARLIGIVPPASRA